MAKPDRFEKMVEHRFSYLDDLDRRGVQELLRRQYYALRRLVKQQTPVKWFDEDGEYGGDYIDRDDLLAAMDCWKKGKP